MPAPSPKNTPDTASEALDQLEQDLEGLDKAAAAANLNDLVLGMSPALAATSLYLSNAHSLSVLYENAVATQQQQTQLAQASLKAGLKQLHALASQGAQAADARMDPDQSIIDLLKAVKEMGAPGR
ncbi:RebB like protein [Roseibium denhamense]|uniref:Killing trait domain-containing protein n=1 Tax=Roseibium denhamense TaxID=76305 RepID=A0ABY1N9D8_9HYPH|nr:RebB family R body protein [Roseibium denhamense]MTI05674.1 RebB like protein [Roseibium denhamense]SMP04108.1 Killing trait domain-containing protein [Roseibium denhamense]